MNKKLMGRNRRAGAGTGAGAAAAKRAAGATVCEMLERRTMLTTFVVNGTAGNDSWSLEVATFIYVNGTPYSKSGVTDIQFNGSDGNDSLVVYDSTLPVTFNGGNNDDTLTLSGGNLANITAQVNFNGGAGTADAVVANDNIWTDNTTYSFFGNTFNRTGTGNFVYDAGVERATLNTGFGDNAIYVSSTAAPVVLTVNGNSGGDYCFDDMTAANSSLTFNGGGGAGWDYLQVSDYNNAAVNTYTMTATFVTRPNRAVFYSALEQLQFQGSGAFNSTYNIQATPAGIQTDVLGGTGNDVFSITASTSSAFSVNGPLGIHGFGGSDSMSFSVAPWISSALTIWMSENSISVNTPSPLVTYEGMASLTVQGPNQPTQVTCDYVVTGTAASITGQTTIFGGTGNNRVYLYPHDAAGHQTIKTNLGIGGQNGADLLIVDDTGQSNGLNYKFYNPFGPGTEDIAGIGPGLVGAGSDVEGIQFNAGDGADNFALETWQTGASLQVNAGGGSDRFDISPTAHNLPAAITSMSYFSFDGGGVAADQSDYFDVINYDNTTAWTISRTTGAITYSAAATGYVVSLNVAHTGYVYASGGTLNDTFVVHSTPAENMNNDLYGAGGNDTYMIGTGLTSGVQSYVNCNGFGGTDSIIIDDSADTVGRTFHMDEQFVNSVPGDSLFPAAGGDVYGIVVPDGITGTVTVKLGSGADTICLAPDETATYVVQANNPTTAPGDRITFAFAAATGPSFTNNGTGAGTYTFGNRAKVVYTGIETTAIDSVAPTMTGGQYNAAPAGGTLPSVDLTFSEDVSAGLYNTYFDAYNLTTSTNYGYGVWARSYDAATNTLRHTFPSLPGGVLPDGNYEADVGRVRDLAGNLMSPYYATFDFFVFAADANHDRAVDLTDFTLLAANFNGTGKTFAQGDFSYDGTVDLTDFTILASKFNQTLAPAPAPAAPPVDAAPAAAPAAAPMPVSAPGARTSPFATDRIVDELI